MASPPRAVLHPTTAVGHGDDTSANEADPGTDQDPDGEFLEHAKPTLEFVSGDTEDGRRCSRWRR